MYNEIHEQFRPSITMAICNGSMGRDSSLKRIYCSPTRQSLLSPHFALENDVLILEGARANSLFCTHLLSNFCMG